MMLKFHSAPGFAKGAERVNVAIARLIPVAKLDPQFERCPGLAHEVRLVDPEHVVEGLDMRQGGFTDADGSDVIGFNQSNSVVFGLEPTPEAGGAHPTRRTPTPDDNSERRRPIFIPNGRAHFPPSWHSRNDTCC